MDGDAAAAVSVLIVRDSGRRWDWLVDALGDRPGIHVVAAEGTPEAAVIHAERHQPDIIVAAARFLQVTTGFLNRLGRTSPRSAIVAIGATDELVALRSQSGDILGMATWEAMTAPVGAAMLESVAAGLRVMTSDLPIMLRKRAETRPLSDIERGVLKALGRGLTEGEIMKACNLTRSTLMRAIRSLKEELGAGTLFALGAESVRRDLLDEER